MAVIKLYGRERERGPIRRLREPFLAVRKAARGEDGPSA